MLSKMDLNQIFQLIFCLLMLNSSKIYCTMIDVMSYGAVGDGVTDDTQAFSKAWKAACGASSSSSSVLNVPQGKKFLLNSFTFQGPCKSPSLNFKVEGEIVAPSQISSWTSSHVWLTFQQVNGLTVNGNGVFDGQGAIWWQSVQGADNRPKALKFSKCNNLEVSGLKHMNSPRNHISVDGCSTATFTDLHIIAPETSPNTDGIDIADSSDVQIHDSYIGTGDDCVAINSGCKNINITGVTCGPGHGISIGSLGKNGKQAEVDGIHVQHCIFNGTQNGARIKTWQGGSGFARNIVFQDITLINARNPIIINQYYSNSLPDEISDDSDVEVSDVSFSGFRGTSTSDEAINLSCSKSVGCTKLLLEHINITTAVTGAIVGSSCINAHGTSVDSSPRVDCLLS